MKSVTKLSICWTKNKDSAYLQHVACYRFNRFKRLQQPVKWRTRSNLRNHSFAGCWSRFATRLKLVFQAHRVTVYCGANLPKIRLTCFIVSVIWLFLLGGFHFFTLSASWRSTDVEGAEESFIFPLLSGAAGSVRNAKALTSSRLHCHVEVEVHSKGRLKSQQRGKNKRLIEKIQNIA